MEISEKEMSEWLQDLVDRASKSEPFWTEKQPDGISFILKCEESRDKFFVSIKKVSGKF